MEVSNPYEKKKKKKKDKKNLSNSWILTEVQSPIKAQIS